MIKRHQKGEEENRKINKPFKQSEILKVVWSTNETKIFVEL